MPITGDQMSGLWGDGGPYSQVQVLREIRILDDHVSRTFYYVKANVNPTTYATLKKREAEIEDEEIRAFLAEAAFISDEEGYEWTIYGQAALTPRGANRASDRATDAITRMHRLVMDALEIEPPPKQEPAADAPEPPESSQADV